MRDENVEFLRPGAREFFAGGHQGPACIQNVIDPPRAASGPGAEAAGRDSRPGGGLGPPVDAPDPLQKHSGYILAGFGTLLAAGAIYITRRSKTVSARDVALSGIEPPTIPLVAKRPLADRSGLLLEALKEEIFQLEVEHKQGRILQPEYERARTALDQTLERALKREATKQG